MTTATATKVKRYLVIFSDRRMFVNATSRTEALAQARTKLLREGSKDEALATFDTFAEKAVAKESLRY